jgi:hypothetical protein
MYHPLSEIELRAKCPRAAGEPCRPCAFKILDLSEHLTNNFEKYFSSRDFGTASVYKKEKIRARQRTHPVQKFI